MWFRNARLYRFTKPLSLTPEALEEKLADAAFQPCGPNDPVRLGWTAPLGRHGEQLVHSANGYHLICLRKEERLLPASVLKEAVNDRVEMIETEQARKVRRREREEIREQLTLEMLPRAFTRSRRCFAYLAPGDGWLIIDAAAAKQAEELTSHLRKTLGTLPVRPPAVQQSPVFTMTGWLQDSIALPQGMSAGMDCELRDPGEEGGIVRCRGLDLHGEDILAHLGSGMQVVRLALDWQESLSFVLDEELALRRLKFGDTLREQLDDIDSEDAVGRFDAAFSLMTLELSRLLPNLLEAFGGEDRSALVEKQSGVAAE